MHPLLWFLLRAAFIGWFACSGFAFAIHTSGFGFDFLMPPFLCIAFLASMWRFYTILRDRYKKKKGRDDWSASLWLSPILRNPESPFVVIGCAFLFAGAAGFGAVAMHGAGAVEPSMMVVFGAGILSGWALFRIRKKKWANRVPSGD
jgi:hypothetical protein